MPANLVESARIQFGANIDTETFQAAVLARALVIVLTGYEDDI